MTDETNAVPEGAPENAVGPAPSTHRQLYEEIMSSPFIRNDPIGYARETLPQHGIWLDPAIQGPSVDRQEIDRIFRNRSTTSISSSSARENLASTRRVSGQASPSEEKKRAPSGGKSMLLNSLISAERARCETKVDPDERDDALGNLVEGTPEVVARIQAGMENYLAILEGPEREEVRPEQGLTLTPDEEEVIMELRRMAERSSQGIRPRLRLLGMTNYRQVNYREVEVVLRLQV